MKRRRNILLLSAVSVTLVLSIALVQAAEEEAACQLGIKEAGLGKGVENRTLVAPGDTFVEESTVYFLTWVVGGSGANHVNHIWIHEEEEKFRIKLPIGGASWRTWSSKTLHPGSVGDWRVEVRDEYDNLLESLSFTCVAKTSK